LSNKQDRINHAVYWGASGYLRGVRLRYTGRLRTGVRVPPEAAAQAGPSAGRRRSRGIFSTKKWKTHI